MGQGTKLVLHRENFDVCSSKILQKLRASSDYYDVSLGCTDSNGKSLQAHKVVISACSSVFKDMTSLGAPMNSSYGSSVFFRGISHQDLSSILDFIYEGEVCLNEERLSSFLLAAEDLKIEGISNLRVSFKERTKDHVQAAENICNPSALNEPSISLLEQTKYHSDILSSISSNEKNVKSCNNINPKIKSTVRKEQDSSTGFIDVLNETHDALESEPSENVSVLTASNNPENLNFQQESSFQMDAYMTFATNEDNMKNNTKIELLQNTKLQDLSIDGIDNNYMHMDSVNEEHLTQEKGLSMPSISDDDNINNHVENSISIQEHKTKVDTKNKKAKLKIVKEKRISGVWSYFKLNPLEKTTASCNQCGRDIKRGSGGETTTMWRHLKTHHTSTLPNIRDDDNINSYDENSRSIQQHKSNFETKDKKAGLDIIKEKRISGVWNYFNVNPCEKTLALCNLCGREINRGDKGETTTLWRHLKTHHTSTWQECKYN